MRYSSNNLAAPGISATSSIEEWMSIMLFLPFYLTSPRPDKILIALNKIVFPIVMLFQ
jgi:hypothetical protein